MEIKVTYKGETATITENNAFRVAEAVEDHLTVGEIALMRASPRGIKYRKLARAYSVLLYELGIVATPEQIAKDFTEGMRTKEGGGIMDVLPVLDNLLFVLMDGAPELEVKDDGIAEKD